MWIHIFSNFFLQKSLNGFFAGPWWKQWLLTFLRLPPSLHPSFPSVHQRRLISLSKWFFFLTPSISLPPFRHPAEARGRCYALWQVKWKPREISSSYKCSEAFSQSKINISPAIHPVLSAAPTDGRKRKKWAVIWRPFGVFLYPQLISAVLFVAGGAEAVHFAFKD